MTKIKDLSAHRAARDNFKWSIKEMLGYAQDDEEFKDYDSAVLILRKKEGENYQFHWLMSHLNASEAVSLIEIVKTDLIKMVSGDS